MQWQHFKFQAANFTAWKKFISKNGYRPRLNITPELAKQTGMSEKERLNENRLGRWEKRAALNTYDWEYKTHKKEFIKIRTSTPTYILKNYLETLNDFLIFISKKGHKPRASISKTAMKNEGLTEAARIDEINLSNIIRNIKRSFNLTLNDLEYFIYPENYRKEFMLLWNKTPTYTQKIQLDKFNEWKSFVKEKGYLPRRSITGKKVASTQKGRKEQQKEVHLGKWASHLETRPLPTAKAQAEFLKIKASVSHH